MNSPYRVAAASGVLSLVVAGVGAISAPGAVSAEGAASPSYRECHHQVGSNLSEGIRGVDVDKLGETLTAIVNADEKVDASGRPLSGLPIGLSVGVIGVIGSSETGFQVIVDPAVVTVNEMADRVAVELPAAEAKAVEVVPACNSSAALATAWKAVDLAAVKIPVGSSIASYLDAETEQVVIEGAPDLAKEVAAGSEAASFMRTEALETSRLSRVDDSTPWSGGIRIRSSPGTCSAGFSVIRNGTSTRAMVTAGHCGPNGLSWVNGPGSGVVVGTSTGRANYPDYDQEMLVGSSYAPNIFTNGADSVTKRTVSGAADPGDETGICTSGIYSLSMCGWTVKSLSATYCDSAGCTTYVIRATKPSGPNLQGGDSGSPLYTRPGASTATIRGILIAGSTSGDPVFWGERYLSIAGHLDVHALIG